VKKDNKELIEKIGVFFEKTGFQPAMGRITSLLFVSDPPYKTFDEIQQSLGLSKGAVSNALNILMSREWVDYITMPGDRKRYFQIKIQSVLDYYQKRFMRQSEFHQILQEVLDVRSKNYPEYNKGIAEICEFLDFIDKEMKAAIDKWQTLKKKG
jgi:DNA-binding transcriptional regulator GbsR (MarR family)